MKVIRTKEELKQIRAQYTTETIGFVPTMGGLHEGHLSLIRRSLKECDCTFVSVFLNPTQFNNPTDLKTYPHNDEDDLRLLESVGVDVVFLPTPDEMYEKGELPPQYDLGQVAEVMEGQYRPGHFQGVVWIVSKLFRLVRPTFAYFGLKDFQQIAVIKQMVKLSPDMDVEIVPCPIVREADGLAMSSRNNRLSDAERKSAPKIFKALEHGKALKASGASVEEVSEQVIREIEKDPLLRVEYFSIVDGETLRAIADWHESAEPVGAITVYCGEVRLIDHIAL